MGEKSRTTTEYYVHVSFSSNMFHKSQRNHQNMSVIFELKIEVYEKRIDEKKNMNKRTQFFLFFVIVCYTTQMAYNVYYTYVQKYGAIKSIFSLLSICLP